MITTTLAELLEAESVLAALEQKRLPDKTGYLISRLTRVVLAETQSFKQQRDAMIRELGAERETTAAEQEQGAGPTTVQVTPNNWPTYLARVTALSQVSVEITGFPLALADLKDAALLPVDMRRLGPLLVDEEPTQPQKE